ncbi:MAG TPA: fructosamine kinase family protein [Miltoncostaeaceae bacterium]|nr:fructosamine kinase family protein [Miltoncostaeaceae bacterium]
MSADALAAAVGRALGAAVAQARPVHGGSINRALQLTLADGRAAFVKHHPDAPAGVFRAEADGLAWLAAADALRTPEVLAVADDPGAPRFLALEWIAPGPSDPQAFGRGLAALHRAGAAAFGWDRDNFIGLLPQRNDPVPGGWPEFYVERRLRPMAGQAVAAGTLDARFLGDLDRLAARLPDLAGDPEPPARLHGDLWGGNAILAAEGGPAVLDPAVYGGHREIDLAMMRLFGGFPAAAFAAYDEAFPLAPGHADRVDLWQLYPLLVHVVLFGGGYAGQARRALARYV